MAAYLGGDERAFRHLFERYAPVLHRYFLRHGKTRHDAADLVQQTFLKLHRSRDDYRTGETLRPWLFTIARNLKHDHARRHQRRPESYCDLDTKPHPEPDTDGLGQEECTRLLSAALDTLPVAQQTLLRAHWIEERSWSEIAACGGMQPGTLRVRAHRACLQLRGRLEAQLAAAA
jgi:RNA polymerase sigma factor (sigma-70 family)